MAQQNIYGGSSGGALSAGVLAALQKSATIAPFCDGSVQGIVALVLNLESGQMEPLAYFLPNGSSYTPTPSVVLFEVCREAKNIQYVAIQRCAKIITPLPNNNPELLGGAAVEGTPFLTIIGYDPDNGGIVSAHNIANNQPYTPPANAVISDGDCSGTKSEIVCCHIYCKKYIGETIVCNSDLPPPTAVVEVNCAPCEQIYIEYNAALGIATVHIPPSVASPVINWTSSGGISIVSGQGTPNITFSVSGAGTLSVSVDSATCAATVTDTVQILDCDTLQPIINFSAVNGALFSDGVIDATTGVPFDTYIVELQHSSGQIITLTQKDFPLGSTDENGNGVVPPTGLPVLAGAWSYTIISAALGECEYGEQPPTTIQVPPAQCCAPVQYAGGQAGISTNIYLGQTSGVVTVSFFTYSIPDQIQIIHNGVVVAGSGAAFVGNPALSPACCATVPGPLAVSGVYDAVNNPGVQGAALPNFGIAGKPNNAIGSATFEFYFDATLGDTITLEVVGNPDNANTIWIAQASCPNGACTCEPIDFAVDVECDGSGNGILTVVLPTGASATVYYNGEAVIYDDPISLPIGTQYSVTVGQEQDGVLCAETVSGVVQCSSSGGTCSIDYTVEVVCAGKVAIFPYGAVIIKSNVGVLVSGLINGVPVLPQIGQSGGVQYAVFKNINNDDNYTIVISEMQGGVLCSETISGTVTCPPDQTSPCDDLGIQVFGFVECSTNKFVLVIDNVYYNSSPIAGYMQVGTQAGDIVPTGGNYNMTLIPLAEPSCQVNIVGVNDCIIAPCTTPNFTANVYVNCANGKLGISINGVPVLGAVPPAGFTIIGTQAGASVPLNGGYNTTIIDNTSGCQLSFSGTNDCPQPPQVPCTLSLALSPTSGGGVPAALPMPECTAVPTGWANCALNDAVAALANTPQSVTFTYYYDGVYSSPATSLNVPLGVFKSEVQAAFQIWKEVLETVWAGLTVNFVEVASGGDIRITVGGVTSATAIAQGGNYANCGLMFLRFNENFVFRPDAAVLNGSGTAWVYNGVNYPYTSFSLGYATAHEIGHCFGLGHEGNITPAYDNNLMDAVAAPDVDLSDVNNLPDMFMANCLLAVYGMGANVAAVSNLTSDSFSVQINGGTAPYNYTVAVSSPNVVLTTASSGTTNSNIINVGYTVTVPGNYSISVTVTDSKNCTDTFVFEIDNGCTVAAALSKNEDCTETTLTISGGTAPYQIEMTAVDANNTQTVLLSATQNGTTAVVGVLPNNTVTILATVTDASGCVATASIAAQCGQELLCNATQIGTLTAGSSRTFVFYPGMAQASVGFDFNLGGAGTVKIEVPDGTGAGNPPLIGTYNINGQGFYAATLNNAANPFSSVPSDFSASVLPNVNNAGRVVFGYLGAPVLVTITAGAQTLNYTANMVCNIPACSPLGNPTPGNIVIEAERICSGGDITIIASIAGDAPWSGGGFDLKIFDLGQLPNAVVVWSGTGSSVNVTLPAGVYMVRATDLNGCYAQTIISCEEYNCGDAINYIDTVPLTYGAKKVYYVNVGAVSGMLKIDYDNENLADRHRVFYGAAQIGDSRWTGASIPLNNLMLGFACNSPSPCSNNDFFMGYVETTGNGTPQPLASMPNDHVYYGNNAPDNVGKGRLFVPYTYNGSSSILKIETHSVWTGATVFNMVVQCPEPPCASVLVAASYDCNNGLQISASGGLAPYTFRDQNNVVYIGGETLAAGTYTFTATDADGCVGVATLVVDDCVDCGLSVKDWAVVCAGYGGNTPTLQVTLQYSGAPNVQGSNTITWKKNGVVVGTILFDPNLSEVTLNSSQVPYFPGQIYPMTLEYYFTNEPTCGTSLVITAADVPNCACAPALQVSRPMDNVIANCGAGTYTAQVTVTYDGVPVGTACTIEVTVGATTITHNYTSGNATSEVVNIPNIPFSTNNDAVFKSYTSATPTCYRVSNLGRIAQDSYCP